MGPLPATAGAVVSADDQVNATQVTQVTGGLGNESYNSSASAPPPTASDIVDQGDGSLLDTINGTDAPTSDTAGAADSAAAAGEVAVQACLRATLPGSTTPIAG